MQKFWNRLVGLASLALMANAAQAQIPCVDGLAGGYPCENMDLMATMGLDDLGVER